MKKLKRTLNKNNQDSFLKMDYEMYRNYYKQLILNRIKKDGNKTTKIYSNGSRKEEYHYIYIDNDLVEIQIYDK